MSGRINRTTFTPFCYVLIHTVSSLLPWLPVLWVGLLVNVPICCIVYWQLVWIARRLGMRDWMALAIPTTFVLGACFVNYAAVFFRMYGLLAVWTDFLSGLAIILLVAMACLAIAARKQGPIRLGSRKAFLLCLLTIPA